MGRITHGFTYFHHEVNMNTRASTLNLATDISSNTYLILNRHNSKRLSLPGKVYYHLFHHICLKQINSNSNMQCANIGTLEYQKAIAFQPHIPEESLSDIGFLYSLVYLPIVTSKCCNNVYLFPDVLSQPLPSKEVILYQHTVVLNIYPQLKIRRAWNHIFQALRENNWQL